MEAQAASVQGEDLRHPKYPCKTLGVVHTAPWEQTKADLWSTVVNQPGQTDTLPVQVHFHAFLKHRRDELHHFCPDGSREAEGGGPGKSRGRKGLAGQVKQLLPLTHSQGIRLPSNAGEHQGSERL